MLQNANDTATRWNSLATVKLYDEERRDGTLASVCMVCGDPAVDRERPLHRFT